MKKKYHLVVARKYLDLRKPLFLFLLLLNVPASQLISQDKYAKENLPVVRWTANSDPMNFRYDFLENTDKKLLYTGNPDSGTWNHHTMITYFDGKLYASWDQHVRDENASGQHGLIRNSSDMGETWTDVEVLFPPLSKKVPAKDPYPYTRFQTNNGFVVMDGVLYAITDVAEWSASGKSKIAPRKKLGRLARSLYSDGSMGGIFWLLDKAPLPVPGIPVFPVGDPALVSKLKEYLSNFLNEPQLMFGVGDYPGSDDNHGTGEGVGWQLEDGTWVKMFRDSGLRGSQSFEEDEASKSRRNYVTYSFDNGKTWTLSTRTSFPDACGRSTAGKLPDGQVYVINAGWPLSNKKGGRSIQTISLSRDGLNFDRMAVLQFIAPVKRYDGRSKAVGFQAYSVVAGDYLFVLSSLNKEDIQLIRIPLKELESFVDMPYNGELYNPETPQAIMKNNMPVVRWTAYSDDDMTFKYNFLENIEHIKLYKATEEEGTWNHHQHITLHNGVVYAVWDSHIRDENAAGQHAKMRQSTDGGITWTPIEVLFPSSAENVPAASDYPETRFQTLNGFAVVDDVLYAATDVAEWSKAGTKKIGPRKKIGRMCRAILQDGELGDIFWLLSEAPEPVEGFPAYPAGDPELVKRILDYFCQPGQEMQLSFGGPGHPASDDNHGMGEPVPSYSLNDGTLVRLYRDGGSKTARNLKEEEATKSRRNYAAFSFDKGVSWTVPTRTSFPDACARTNAGTLPDGQVYVINNVLPLSTKKGGRSLLAISLSRDGLNFDRVAVIRFLPPPKCFEGRSKSVGYAYPHSVVVGDHLLVIHSVNKEDIEVTRIPISELTD